VSEQLAGREGWRNLGVAELARQYNARATVPDVEPFLRDYREQSTPMYALPHVRDLRYGPSSDELLDLFPVPGRADAPLFVFVHGGYWRSLVKEDSVFMASNFTQHGIAVASINYQLAPQASLHEIVAQCRRSLAWLYRNGAAHGMDVNRIVVSGSSAGGHLGAMLLSQDWQAAAGVPQDVVKAAILVSGLYDLAPVQQTTPNDWLNLGVEEAVALSPIHSLPCTNTRLCIAVAEQDTDEFKRQSLMYAAACRQGGCSVQYLEVPQRNHFDVILEWMNPDAALTKLAWALFDPA